MRDTWYCKFCLRQSEVEHDGTNGFCLGCETPVVRRQNSNDIFDAPWYPLAEFVVGVVSRPAGMALKTLDKIEDTAPPRWQPLINLAGVAIIAIIGGVIFNEVFSDS